MENEEPEGLSSANEISILRDQLTACAMLYQSDNIDRQRQAVLSALFAVTDFLTAQAFPPETLFPLMRPAIALAERENNAIDSLFAQRARAGRPKATIDELERVGILAAFANAWLIINEHDGRDQRAKLSDAAREMCGGWFGDVSRAKLKAAREIVSQEGIGHPSVIVAGEFNRYFDEAIKLVGRGKAFKHMISFVNNSPASRSMGILKTPTVLSADKG